MEFNPALLGLMMSFMQGKGKDGEKSPTALPMEKIAGILSGGAGLADIMELLPMDEQMKGIFKMASALGQSKPREQKTEISSARVAQPFSEVKGISGNEINLCLYRLFNSQKQ
ncbi:MAG: hypothetical protein LBC13_03200 [Clostridiales bacterium]|jgi:hypothetical protein|nr:hypothetical protein [Clostridiales bacterium]